MVNDSARKSGLPPMAASSGVMKLSVNAVTRAPKATPMITATARSTTLPRRRNFRKPLMALPWLDGGVASPASCRRRAPRSGNRKQHAGVEDAGGGERGLNSGEGGGERLGPPGGGPPHGGSAGGMGVGGRAARGGGGPAGPRPCP